MGFREQVRQEISARVEALASNGQRLVPDWIAHEICNSHVDGLNAESEESGFWRQGGYHSVRAETGQYLRKYYSADTITDDGRQRSLPGFSFVQTHYIVDRDGDEIAIPTPDLTTDEIKAIVSRIRATAGALFAHADELERYEQTRDPPPLLARINEAVSAA